jgi:hypothetical protein
MWLQQFSFTPRITNFAPPPACLFTILGLALLIALQAHGEIDYGSAKNPKTDYL